MRGKEEKKSRKKIMWCRNKQGKLHLASEYLTMRNKSISKALHCEINVKKLRLSSMM